MPAHLVVHSSILDRWVRHGAVPIDASGLSVFRMAFGLVMAWWSADYLLTGRVDRLCSEPLFHFTYYGLDWVRPWPGHGMLIEFWLMLGCGLAIALGWGYRMAAVGLAICFTHFFLLDRTLYQNHYYLMILIAWWMPWLPLKTARQW